MSEMKRFVYFGKVPTNVCWNGVSFPIMPGDVIKCHPDFIKAFLSPKVYKEAPESNTKEAKHTFPKSPIFLRPDPMGGLPMRSDPTAGPRLKDNPRYRPALDDTEISPYVASLGGAQEVIPKLEISTVPQKVITPAEPVAPPVKEQVIVAEEEVEVEEEEVFVAPVELVTSVSKTTLRKATREEIYNQMIIVREEGCSLKPEMKDTFDAFTTTATRGEMFAALWEYYSFDKE